MTNNKNIRIHWSAHYLFAYSLPMFSAILSELTCNCLEIHTTLCPSYKRTVGSKRPIGETTPSCYYQFHKVNHIWRAPIRLNTHWRIYELPSRLSTFRWYKGLFCPSVYFLIRCSLAFIPSAQIDEPAESFLNRLKRRQKLFQKGDPQIIWSSYKIWSNLKIDNIVIICEDNVSPNKWLLGRIINTYPGYNGMVCIWHNKDCH